MNSDERDERLKQIRERWARTTFPDQVFTSHVKQDIDFLLSLLDSYATLPRPVHRNYECMTTVTDETLWCPTCACRAEYLRGHKTAATIMRDLCVEKVKVMGQQWQEQRLREKRDLMEHAAMMCGTKTEAAYEITRILESLTLDQVEEKQ